MSQSDNLQQAPLLLKIIFEINPSKEEKEVHRVSGASFYSFDHVIDTVDTILRKIDATVHPTESQSPTTATHDKAAEADTAVITPTATATVPGGPGGGGRGHRGGGGGGCGRLSRQQLLQQKMVNKQQACMRRHQHHQQQTAQQPQQSQQHQQQYQQFPPSTGEPSSYPYAGPFSTVTSNGSHTLEYTDDEGDRIVVASQVEWDEAVYQYRHMLKMKSSADTEENNKPAPPFKVCVRTRGPRAAAMCNRRAMMALKKSSSSSSNNNNNHHQSKTNAKQIDTQHQQQQHGSETDDTTNMPQLRQCSQLLSDHHQQTEDDAQLHHHHNHNPEERKHNDYMSAPTAEVPAAQAQGGGGATAPMSSALSGSLSGGSAGSIRLGHQLSATTSLLSIMMTGGGTDMLNAVHSDGHGSSGAVVGDDLDDVLQDIERLSQQTSISGNNSNNTTRHHPASSLSPQPQLQTGGDEETEEEEPSEEISAHSSSSSFPLPQRSVLSRTLNKGKALMQQGDHVKAEHTLQFALKSHPHHPLLWYQLACARCRCGRLEAALDAVHNAVYQCGFCHTESLLQEAALEPIRSHPRFVQMMNHLLDHK